MLRLQTQLGVKRPAVNNQRNNVINRNKQQNVAFCAGGNQASQLQNDYMINTLLVIGQAQLLLTESQEDLRKGQEDITKALAGIQDGQAVIYNKLNNIENAQARQDDPSTRPIPDHMFS